ncbi:MULTISPECIES: MCE family protein [Rhodococcus]|uniref:MCE family protein n=1 Tax=Rhodococcus TaxID=1827 RepID=UPI000C9AB793|nr:MULTISPECIES: MCE family protein [Rhodococcus]PND49776.1 virulence factor Mce [Rhodococcus sp. ENV425]WKW99227.1 MCE family protein [Rhodococcus aetherivorans]
MRRAQQIRDALRAVFAGRSGRAGNPLVVGAVGIVLVALVMTVALAAPRATYLLRTNGYTAEFANAAGLQPNDPVYVAGVPAGRVESLELAADRVIVAFRVDGGQPLGDRTTAEVRLRTILGKIYLAVTPAGAGELPGGRIPLARTSVPYSLDDLASEAQHVARELDVPALEAMMHTLADAVPSDPGRIADALAGATAAAEMLSRNDARIHSLLQASKSLTSIVAGQSRDVELLVQNATTVVSILEARKESLVQLVEDLRLLTEHTATFLTDNSGEMDALLGNMRSVTDTLNRNAEQIDVLMTRLPPALRAAADASGNGNWVDVHAPAGPIPDNLLCALGVMEGCR